MIRSDRRGIAVFDGWPKSPERDSKECPFSRRYNGRAKGKWIEPALGYDKKVELEAKCAVE
jgi:hypothetical protein